MMSDIVRTCTDAHRVAAAIRKRDMARGSTQPLVPRMPPAPRLGWSASLSDGSDRCFRSLLDDDGFGPWPAEAMRANPDGEWETTVPRSRRRGGGASGSGARHGSAAGGSSSADGSGAYADAGRGPPSVHLKHVSADAPLSGGKRMAIGEHNSDEGHSDETQLLNEEDWSSAGSADRGWVRVAGACSCARGSPGLSRR